MPQFEPREWIAYGIITAIVLLGVAGVASYKRRQRWRRLRLAGDGEAKRRELRLPR